MFTLYVYICLDYKKNLSSYIVIYNKNINTQHEVGAEKSEMCLFFFKVIILLQDICNDCAKY